MFAKNAVTTSSGSSTIRSLETFHFFNLDDLKRTLCTAYAVLRNTNRNIKSWCTDDIEIEVYT